MKYGKTSLLTACPLKRLRQTLNGAKKSASNTCDDKKAQMCEQKDNQENL